MLLNSPSPWTCLLLERNQLGNHDNLKRCKLSATLTHYTKLSCLTEPTLIPISHYIRHVRVSSECGYFSSLSFLSLPFLPFFHISYCSHWCSWCLSKDHTSIAFSGQSISNLNVYVHHMGAWLKCRLWFSTSRVGSGILFGLSVPEDKDADVGHTLSSFKTKVLSFLELLERTNSNKTCHNLLLMPSFAGVIPMPHLGRLWPLSLLLKDRLQGTISNSSCPLWCRTEVAETSKFQAEVDLKLCSITFLLSLSKHRLKGG